VFNGWFADKGEFISVVATVITMVISAIMLGLAIEKKGGWWVKLLFGLLIIVLSASLFQILREDTFPRWVAGILGVTLAWVVGMASKYLAGSSRRSSGTGEAEAPVINTPAVSMGVLNVALERADQIAGVEYTRKLRILLRNLSASELVIGPGTRWQQGTMRVREIPEQVWELEPKDGWHSNKWTHNEVPELRVPPGRAFRTWIGLHSSADENEVALLLAEKRLGTLVVPIRAIGPSQVQQIVL
jgi:hypothetical protein